MQQGLALGLLLLRNLAALAFRAAPLIALLGVLDVWCAGHFWSLLLAAVSNVITAGITVISNSSPQNSEGNSITLPKFVVCSLAIIPYGAICFILRSLGQRSVPGCTNLPNHILNESAFVIDTLLLLSMLCLLEYIVCGVLAPDNALTPGDLECYILWSYCVFFTSTASGIIPLECENCPKRCIDCTCRVATRARSADFVAFLSELCDVRRWRQTAAEILLIASSFMLQRSMGVMACKDSLSSGRTYISYTYLSLEIVLMLILHGSAILALFSDKSYHPPTNLKIKAMLILVDVSGLLGSVCAILAFDLGLSPSKENVARGETMPLASLLLPRVCSSPAILLLDLCLIQNCKALRSECKLDPMSHDWHVLANLLDMGYYLRKAIRLMIGGRGTTGEGAAGLKLCRTGPNYIDTLLEIQPLKSLNACVSAARAVDEYETSVFQCHDAKRLAPMTCEVMDVIFPMASVMIVSDAFVSESEFPLATGLSGSRESGPQPQGAHHGISPVEPLTLQTFKLEASTNAELAERTISSPAGETEQETIWPPNMATLEIETVDHRSLLDNGYWHHEHDIEVATRRLLEAIQDPGVEQQISKILDEYKQIKPENCIISIVWEGSDTGGGVQEGNLNLAGSECFFPFLFVSFTGPKSYITDSYGCTVISLKELLALAVADQKARSKSQDGILCDRPAYSIIAGPAGDALAMPAKDTSDDELERARLGNKAHASLISVFFSATVKVDEDYREWKSALFGFIFSAYKTRRAQFLRLDSARAALRTLSEARDALLFETSVALKYLDVLAIALNHSQSGSQKQPDDHTLAMVNSGRIRKSADISISDKSRAAATAIPTETAAQSLRSSLLAAPPPLVGRYKTRGISDIRSISTLENDSDAVRYVRTVTILFELLLYQPYLLNRLHSRKQTYRLEELVRQVFGGRSRSLCPSRANGKMAIGIRSPAGPVSTNLTILLLCLDQIKYIAIELCTTSIEVEIERVPGPPEGLGHPDRFGLPSGWGQAQHENRPRDARSVRPARNPSPQSEMAAPAGVTVLLFRLQSLYRQENCASASQPTFSSVIAEVREALKCNLDEFGPHSDSPGSRRLPRGTALRLHLETLRLIAQRGGLEVHVRLEPRACRTRQTHKVCKAYNVRKACNVHQTHQACQENCTDQARSSQSPDSEGPEAAARRSQLSESLPTPKGSWTLETPGYDYIISLLV